MVVSGGFGERLRVLRKAKGLSQSELAVAVGVNSVTVCRWERGAFLPDLRFVQALADKLSVRPSWLAFGDGKAPKAAGGDHA